jgi:hypothetical protein
MSKRTKGVERRPREKRPHVGRLKLAAAGLSLCAVAAGVAATRYDTVRRAVGLQPLMVAPAQQSLPLSKEYVYAGGRLVATEEPAAAPTPTPAGSPPTNLVAAATSASSVSLSWTAPGAGVLGYVVERRAASGAQEIPTGSSSTSFNDTTPSGDYAYLYRVKAVYAGGASLYSNQDLATTVMFTDNSLRGVTIKAVHLTELRRAVNAVRRLVPNLGDAPWTYPDPVSSPAPQRRAVYLEDVTDLRARLDEALGPLGLPAGGYPSIPTLARGAVVNADHFEQIRQRVR